MGAENDNFAQYIGDGLFSMQHTFAIAFITLLTFMKILLKWLSCSKQLSDCRIVLL